MMVGAALAHLISQSVIGPIAKLGRLASAAESGGDLIASAPRMTIDLRFRDTESAEDRSQG